MAQYKVSGNIATSLGWDGSRTPDSRHPLRVLLLKLVASGSLKAKPISCTQSSISSLGVFSLVIKRLLLWTLETLN